MFLPLDFKQFITSIHSLYFAERNISNLKYLENLKRAAHGNTDISIYGLVAITKLHRCVCSWFARVCIGFLALTFFRIHIRRFSLSLYVYIQQTVNRLLIVSDFRPILLYFSRTLKKKK